MSQGAASPAEGGAVSGGVEGGEGGGAGGQEAVEAEVTGEGGETLQAGGSRL